MPIAASNFNEGSSSLPLVIANPRSASGATRENWSATAADLRAHFGPFSVAFTKHQGHAIELAENAARAGRQFIIACGGDGTINEVANGILRSGVDAELGILPSGTGGDFRRSLKIPDGNRDAAVSIRNGETKRIDVGKVSFVDPDGKDASRFFLNVSSVGLAAEVIRRVKSTKVFDWLPVNSIKGRANFAVSAAQELLSVDPSMISVSVDDRPSKNVQTIAFCVANGRYFGGGMMIAPDAKLADGLLDITNVGDISTARIIANAHTLYRGTHLDLAEVGSATAKRIRVESTCVNPINIEVDGELLGTLPAIYEVVPSAIRIRVPRLTR